MGALFALMSSLSWGTSDFLGGRATQRFGALRVLACSQFVALALLVAAVASLLAAGAVELDAQRLAVAGLGGCAGVVALAMFYSALAIGPMALVPPIAASGVALPVLVGLLRGDAPGALAIFGLVLAVAGVVLASTAPGVAGATEDVALGANSPTRLAPRTLLLALGAAVGFALIFVALDWATDDSAASAVTATAGARLGGSLVIVAALLATRTRPLRGMAPRTLAGLGLIGILDSGANLGFALATVLGRLEVAAVLASLYPAVTSGLAAVVLGDRIGRLQFVGVACAIGGIVLLAQG
ncbi:MAG: hypothetical protein JWN72_2177 [Thermoleophilia bacterium]|nr:hypothetical protein [Thermoleophilia bacterium]